MLIQNWLQVRLNKKIHMFFAGKGPQDRIAQKFKITEGITFSSDHLKFEVSGVFPSWI